MLRAFLLIIVGLSGDPEHGELFHKWGDSLVDAGDRLGIDESRLIYLADRTSPDSKATARSSKVEVEKAFATLAEAAGPDDLVYVVLFGHGSYDGRTARFNMPGPDMTAADFDRQVSRLRSTQIVFVNTASASGPFIEELSGPGRTVVTATRSGAEQYATLFGGYFVDGLGAESADADRNRRISVLEAFNFAKGEVLKAYEREGLLPIEHALLDDDGDREGTPEPAATAADGRVAAVLSLGSTEAESLPSDPRVRALFLERRDLERQVESLRLLKDSMPAARYTSELERLVTALALKTRELRTAEGAAPPQP
ncbi:MAG: hypothetical protein HOP14_01690 [Acidobacteria bacterium]|nr:hypothetical protein [Acidobacteriota bacterium]